MHPIAVGLFVVAGFAGPSVADECRHEAPREARIEAEGVERVRIEARAGWLTVLGRPDSRVVSVDGLACASSESRLDGIELRAERTGSTVHIEAIISDQGWGLTGGSALLNLSIEVPSSVALDIVDSSGELEVSGVAAAQLEDSSGDIRASRITGDLRIEDSSGSIDVSDVAGEVWVNDSSGSIVIRDVGSVMIDRDSSGGIDIQGIEGDVVVRRDTSGGIEVREVGGNLTVGRDGSGGIRHAGVAGRVSLPDKK
jgi:hypothetical protein